MNGQKWIVTFGGAGMSPVAPGTAGSLAAGALFYLLWLGLNNSADLYNSLYTIIFFAGWMCVMFGPWAIEYYGRKDPGACVLDEVAGMGVTMLWLPINHGWRGWVTFVSAFVAFRIFDVIKPWPCKSLEKLPAGWGILMDDLAAGVYANVVCQVFLRYAIGAV